MAAVAQSIADENFQRRFGEYDEEEMVIRGKFYTRYKGDTVVQRPESRLRATHAIPPPPPPWEQDHQLEELMAHQRRDHHSAEEVAAAGEQAIRE